MKQETIHEIPLARIRPNPHNPRRQFSGPEFESLVASIRAAGLLQPIMVRPVHDGDITHEVVFGGRRFAACRKIAEENGGIGDAAIPCRVMDLDDDQALDLMTIENLQRDDLTPWEEAAGFKTFVDRRDDTDAAVIELARRTGIRTQYIRRRLAIYKLPKKFYKAWAAGKLTYTHLRQFIRIAGDRKRLNELFIIVIEW